MRVANERALARAGYSVVTACDGEEALSVAGARMPNLIVLDMLLPRLGGSEARRPGGSPRTEEQPFDKLNPSHHSVSNDAAGCQANFGEAPPPTLLFFSKRHFALLASF